MIYTVLDFETNGLIGPDEKLPDVLSYSAKKYEFNHETGERKLLSELENFYHTKNGAPILKEVEDVTGLNVSEINKKRQITGTTAMHFDDAELGKLNSFIEDGEAVVAQNGLKFDFKFLKGLKKEIKTIDPYQIGVDQKIDTGVRRIRKDKTTYYGLKNQDFAYHYGIDFSEDLLHDASVDVNLTADVFDSMLKDEKLETYFESQGIKTGPKQKFEKKKQIRETGHKTNVLKDTDGNVMFGKKNQKIEILIDRAKTYGDDFAKLSKGKKVGLIGGIVAGTVGVGLIADTVKHKRKAEAQEKWDSVTSAVAQNRKNGGF